MVFSSTTERSVKRDDNIVGVVKIIKLHIAGSLHAGEDSLGWVD